MFKHLRKTAIITKEELIADFVFFSVSAIMSFILIFIFDIHWSFYEWPITLKFIFKTPYPYILFTLIGAVIGFFIIKLLMYGFLKEARVKNLKKLA